MSTGKTIAPTRQNFITLRPGYFLFFSSTLDENFPKITYFLVFISRVYSTLLSWEKKFCTMIEAHDFCNGKLIGSIFIGRTDAGTEALILWPPDVKN